MDRQSQAEAVAAFASDQCGEVPLCVNCLLPSVSTDDFCYSCSAPIGAYSAVHPIERIWATSWIAWKATWTVGARPWHAATATAVMILVILSTAAVAFSPGDTLTAGSLSGDTTSVIGGVVFNAVIVFHVVFNAAIMALCVRTIRNVRRSAATLVE